MTIGIGSYAENKFPPTIGHDQQKALGILGPTPCRIGNPPKRLLPYRTTTPRGKIKVEFMHPDTGETHAVEILGTGQQFVAVGTHPKTKQPYRWERGDLIERGLDGLSEVTPGKVDEFLEAVTLLMVKAGYEVANKPHSSGSVGGADGAKLIGDPSLMCNPEMGKKALAVLPNDLKYDEWIKHSHAIKAMFGGDDQYYPIYETWSLQFTGNTPEGVRAKWDSITNARVGAPFILKRAREIAGFVSEGAIDDAGRRTLKLNSSLDDTVRAVDRIFAELDPPGIFQRGNSLVEVVHADATTTGSHYQVQAGTGVFHVLGQNELRLATSKHVDFIKYNATQKKWLPAKAPADVAQVMHTAVTHWTVPHVVALSETPILCPDGRIIQDRGYDPASGLIFTGGAPEIFLPDNPTQADAIESAGAIMNFFDEFPFADITSGDALTQSPHAAVLLAYILTVAIRNHMPVAPLFLFRAHTAGTGKGLIVEAANTIVLGRNATLMPPLSGQGAGEEERKRITSMLMRGITSAHLDNCTGDIGSGPLDALLTSSTWTDRILSRNDVPTLPQRMTLAASGNNIGVKGDTVRRVLICSMDANVENPELRTFKRENLIADIRRNRGELLGHIFTILRAHLLAGRPNGESVKLGSFEQWAQLVAAAVIWCGYQNPVKTQEEAREDDPVRGSVANILKALHSAYGSEQFQAKDIEKDLNDYNGKAETAAVLSEAWDAVIDIRSPKSHSKAIGNWLRSHKGQVVEGLKVIETKKDRRGVWLWRLTQTL